jgi:hypothetical protein
MACNGTEVGLPMNEVRPAFLGENARRVLGPRR